MVWLITGGVGRAHFQLVTLRPAPLDSSSNFDKAQENKRYSTLVL
jgi:hypothetical protein